MLTLGIIWIVGIQNCFAVFKNLMLLLNSKIYLKYI